MTEKAILVASVFYDRLVAEYGGEPPQPWVKVRAAMQADKATRYLVEFLPKRLGPAVKRDRKERLMKGRPLGVLSDSGSRR